MIGHFKITDKKTVCGRKITKTMFIFKSLGYAFSGLKSPEGYSPCRQCVKILRED